jgi:beta-glucosidase
MSVGGCCTACANHGTNWKYFTFAATPMNFTTVRCWCHPVNIVKRTTKQGMMSGTCAGGGPAPPAGPVVYYDGTDSASATTAAAAADLAIVVIAQSSHENADRVNISLDQSEVVTTVSAAQPNTIVVTISPGPFVTPWREAVAAILDMGMAGEQEGNAVMDVLFGDVNPAGKLPHTLPNVWNEMGMTSRQYPGVPPTDSANACQDIPTPPDANGLNPQGGTGAAFCEPTKAYYDEKLLVGYRWYVFPTESYTR